VADDVITTDTSPKRRELNRIRVRKDGSNRKGKESTEVRAKAKARRRKFKR
jgi:hypothetical protein